MKKLITALLAALFVASLYAEDKAKEAETEKSEKSDEAKEAETEISAQEKLFIKSMDFLDKVAKVVNSANDEASTNAAIAKLKTLADEAKAIKAEGEKIGMNKLSPERIKELREKYKDRQQKLETTIISIMSKLKENPELAKAFQEITNKIK